GNGLGRFAQGDGQDAGGERIERARMAGLLGIEDAAHRADGLRRSHALGLVQDHPAMDGVTLFAAAHYSSSSPSWVAARSRLTRSDLRIFSIFWASAKDSSSTKRSSGV